MAFTVSNASGTAAGNRRTRIAAGAAIGLCLITFWMLLHPYEGVTHDSVLYALGALARLHPESLAHDVFLKFGSQDQYTIFSPLLAQTIRLLGFETSMAILTLVSQLAFFAFGWLLARRLMPTHLALLALGMLIVAPSGYGSYRIFEYGEGFLTPRLIAQALVLGALAAAVAQRRAWAMAGLAAAALLHPIMAAAGIVMLSFLWLGLPRPRTMLLAIVLGLGLLLIVGLFVPYGPFARIDAGWLQLLMDRSFFLFVGSWNFQDWVRTCIPLSVLAVGALLCLEPSVRNTSIAALLTASAGLLLTAVACDFLHLATASRVQPWRWLWLAQATAALLVPIVVRDGWSRGPLARATVLLLAIAWILRGQSFDGLALAAALSAVMLAASTNHVRPMRAAQIVFAGTLAMLLPAILLCLADKWTLVTLQGDVRYLPSTIDRLRLMGRDGVLAAMLLVLFWWRVRSTNKRTELALLLALGIGGCAALLPWSWGKWTTPRYSASLHEAFASWRRQIPPASEVLWSQNPLGTWYWLERPSYLSLAQTAGIVFFRQAALELRRRARHAGPLLTEELSDWIPSSAHGLPATDRLPAVCRSGEIDFVVADRDLGLPPLATLAPYPEHPRVQLRLYRCANIRG